MSTTMPNDTPIEGKQYTRLILGTRHHRIVYLVKHEWLGASFRYWQMGGCALDDGSSRDFREAFLTDPADVGVVFEASPLTNKQWWRVMDYMKQAYALKDAAMVYQYGGHLANNKLANDIVNKTAADELNADAEVVLCAAWSILEQSQRRVDLDHRVNQAIEAMGE